MARIKRGKTLEQMNNQLNRIMSVPTTERNRGLKERALKSYRKYLNNVVLSKRMSNMLENNFNKAVNTKISRSTYMGLNNG